MKVNSLHPWVTNLQEAEKIQEELRRKVIIRPIEKEISTICGVDSSYSDDIIQSAAVICEFPSLEIIEIVTLRGKVKFSYKREFLAFREGENIVKLIEKIKKDVDCFIFDGHGIAHPRKIGLASHIGILINKPSIGCAKKILYGTYSEPPLFPLASTFIKDKEGEIIGHALRNYNKKILFISPGHLVDLKNTLEITIKCLKENLSLPYPLFLADKYSKISS